MEVAFLICFLVGIGFTVISFLIGNISDALGADGFDLDFHSLGIDVMLPLSPTLIITALTVFGGIGTILSRQSNPLAMWIIIFISVIAGLAASTCMYKFIIKPLKKAQNTSTPELDDLIGNLAVVQETITKDGFGEIQYIINGNSYSAPAKSTNGEKIKAGTSVSICWIKDYVFYVVKIEE